MAQALGVRFLDGRGGRSLRAAAALAGLARIDATGIDRRLREVTCVAATDVDNPLTGPAGASAVYGPQKGASPDDVVVLDRALAPSGRRRARATSASTCATSPAPAPRAGWGSA